jgi:hypothetical protein
MSQRESGYQRKALDSYETPAWVTECLLPHIDGVRSVWEPAAGAGQMAQALSAAGLQVTATDISTGHDFLLATARPVDAIVSNPPYSLAQEFIEHALALTKPSGMVAMLLRCDFDHAKTRQHLFGQCPQFAKKLVLTKRIRWIEGSNGSPSFNHAWQIWCWKHKGPPTLAYGP